MFVSTLTDLFDNKHEINYAAHDLELSTIVHVLRMWRHYLIGIKFEKDRP
jgi:hypothetical protein